MTEQSESPPFIKEIDELLSVSPEALVRRETLGEMDFSKGLTLFSKYYRFLAELRDLDYSKLPNGKIHEVSQAVSDASVQFAAVRNFTLNAPYPQGPASFRNQLIDNVDAQFTDALGRLAPVVAYARRHKDDFSAQRALLESEINQARELTAEQRRLRDEALSTVAAIKTAAGETGVANNAQYFDAEVKEQSRAQWLWFISTIFVALVTLFVAVESVNSYVEAITHLDTQRAIQVGVAKLAAISVLYFVLVLLSRNYMATTHNVIVNRHRRNALQTFEAFVKASKDDATRDAVLLRATEAIFAPEASGYLKTESDGKASGPHFFEIFRSAKD